MIVDPREIADRTKAAGKTIGHLSDLAGRDPATFWRWLNDSVDPRLDTVRAFNRALDLIEDEIPTATAEPEEVA